MRRVFLMMMVVGIAAFTACGEEEVFSLGERVSDDAHAFLAANAHIVDKVGETASPEEYAYLLIGFEVENARGQQDILRDWSDLIQVEDARREECEPISLGALEDQLWNTTLSPSQKEAGTIAFTAPAVARDFRLTFRFPVSETDAIYEFRAEDERIGIRVDVTLQAVEQIERGRRIPVVGRALASFTRAPIRYFGEVLVHEDEVLGLLEQLQGLSQEARRKMTEAYVRQQKGWD